MTREPACSYEDHYGETHEPECPPESECTVCHPRPLVRYEVYELSDRGEPLLIRARYDATFDRGFDATTGSLCIMTEERAYRMARKHAAFLAQREDKRLGVVRAELVDKF